MKLKLDKQSVYILLLAILFSVAILLLIFYNLSSQKRTSRLISHSREEIEQIETVLLLMQDCETGSRGFVITNDEKFQEPYKSALQKLPKVLIRIKELTRDQVVQQKNFTTLSYLVKRK
jgi:CHASE3 domain sensor protein